MNDGNEKRREINDRCLNRERDKQIDIWEDILSKGDIEDKEEIDKEKRRLKW